MYNAWHIFGLRAENSHICPKLNNTGHIVSNIGSIVHVINFVLLDY